MVPLERLSLEHYCYHDSKDSKGDYLLNDLQLHEVERTAVLNITDPVCRHLCAVFEEGDCP